MKMGVESVSPAAVSQAAGSNQSTDSNQVSDLMRLEQDVRKMKNEYRTEAQKRGLSSNAIDIKIKEYDKLIAQIEQQIQQARQDAARKTVQTRHSRKTDPRRQPENPKEYVAELQASYLALPSPSTMLSDITCAPGPSASGSAPEEPAVTQEPAVSADVDNIQLDTLV